MRHLIVTVLVLGCLVSPASGQQAEPGKTQSEQQAGSNRNDLPGLSLPVRVIETPIPTEADKQREQESDQREIDDLAAQQLMAEATEDIVRLSELQLILTLIGTVALIFSIALNRKATHAAVQGAQAAKETIGAERAWITQDGTSTTPMRDVHFEDGVEAQAFALCVNWRNYGRTPATKVDGFSDHALVAPGDPMPVFTPGINNNPSSAIVGPGFRFESMPRIIRYADYLRLQERTVRLFVYSKVQYADIFNPEVVRETQYCAEIELNGELVQNGVRLPNVRVNPVGPQNTAT